MGKGDGLMPGLVKTPGDFGNERWSGRKIEGKPLAQGWRGAVVLIPKCPQSPHNSDTLCSESIKERAGTR